MTFIRFDRHKVVCTGCGAEVGAACTCGLAYQILSDKRESDRKRAKAYRARKSQTKTTVASRDAPWKEEPVIDVEPLDEIFDSAASAEAREAEYAAAELANDLADCVEAMPEPEVEKTEEWWTPLEALEDKWVVLYRASFGPFDSKVDAERWARAHYPNARLWEQEAPPKKKRGRPKGSKKKPAEARPVYEEAATP